MDPVITNNDLGQVITNGRQFQDGIMAKPSGDFTVLVGTILGRDTTTLNFIPYVKGASGDSGDPLAVMGYGFVATASGDIPVRPCVAGDFDAGLLVIHADGDASNVDAVVLDRLRHYGLVALPVSERMIRDNQ